MREDIVREVSAIKKRVDYLDRPDLVSRVTFLETELNRIDGISTNADKSKYYLNIFLY